MPKDSRLCINCAGMGDYALLGIMERLDSVSMGDLFIGRKEYFSS